MKNIINWILRNLPFNTCKWLILHLGKKEFTWAGDEGMYYYRLGDWCACKTDIPLYRNKGQLQWYYEIKCKIQRALMNLE